jgi:hypothetical protein
MARKACTEPRCSQSQCIDKDESSGATVDVHCGKVIHQRGWNVGERLLLPVSQYGTTDHYRERGHG